MNPDPKNSPVPFALFAAGLGDVIRVIYQNDSYRRLCEAASPVPVIVASHNPFATEIFRFHRNAKNFVLYDLGHKFEEFIGAGLRGPAVTKALAEFAGLVPEGLFRGNPPAGYVPAFDAPDDIDSDGHIVLQPFAGATDTRTWKPELTDRVVAALRRQPRRVFIVSRSYARRRADGRAIHGAEDARRYAGGNIEVLENLSVPATLNLVRRSAGYVGSWSSMHQAAWLENKPVAVYYPKNFVDVVGRTGYAFGIDRPDCLHADYEGFDLRALEAWLRDPITRPSMSGPMAPFWDWVGL